MTTIPVAHLAASLTGHRPEITTISPATGGTLAHLTQSSASDVHEAFTLDPKILDWDLSAILNAIKKQVTRTQKPI